VVRKVKAIAVYITVKRGKKRFCKERPEKSSSVEKRSGGFRV